MKRIFSIAICLAAVSAASPALPQAEKPNPRLARPVLPQADKPNPRPMPCPDPQYQTIAPASADPVQSQFTPLVWGIARANLNEQMPNKQFLHTFQWKDDGCCQVMGATVTIRMKSIQPSSTRTSADSGNDSYSLWHNGVGMVGVGGFIWPLGTPAGTVATRTMVLTPAMLAAINTNNMLSVAVQDDTTVEAVQLQLNRCCLKKR